MQQLKKLLTYATFASIWFFTGCTKVVCPDPGNGNSNGNNNGNPGSVYVLKVKAVIGIGDIIYDSIPASLEITSWDSSNNAHQKNIELVAGANSISLPKSHLRYKLKLTKWGIQDERSFTKQEMPEGTVINMGGSRAPKKLRLEESFMLVEGSYRPDSKVSYTYNTNGAINYIEYYQKLPAFADLRLQTTNVFAYNGGRVIKISRWDVQGEQFGFTEFTYSPQGKILNIFQKSYDQETGAAVAHAYDGGYGNIDIDYLFNNGNSMEYKMTFKGGNKIEDVATSSRGGGEGGTYGYDFYINPYAHINMPDLFLSNISKNNLVSQQKSFGGSIPSSIPYKFEYTYDSEGYPVELLKSYKSYQTGEHLFTVKTVFHYLT